MILNNCKTHRKYVGNRSISFRLYSLRDSSYLKFFGIVFHSFRDRQQLQIFGNVDVNAHYKQSVHTIGCTQHVFTHYPIASFILAEIIIHFGRIVWIISGLSFENWIVTMANQFYGCWCCWYCRSWYRSVQHGIIASVRFTIVDRYFLLHPHHHFSFHPLSFFGPPFL